jgi:hypothetical protein
MILPGGGSGRRDVGIDLARLGLRHHGDASRRRAQRSNE